MKKNYVLRESIQLLPEKSDEVGGFVEENVFLIELAACLMESGRVDDIFELICYHIF